MNNIIWVPPFQNTDTAFPAKGSPQSGHDDMSRQTSGQATWQEMLAAQPDLPEADSGQPQTITPGQETAGTDELPQPPIDTQPGTENPLPAITPPADNHQVSGIDAERFVPGRTVPMQAFATGHLAYLSTGTPAHDGGSAIPVTKHHSAIPQTQLAGRGSAPMTNTTTGQGGFAPINGTGSNQVQSQQQLQQRLHQLVERSLGNNARPADADWLARRFQIVERNRQLEVRIRDYHLDESAREQITRAVLEFARESGQSVQRILVNGHVTWNASDGIEHREFKGETK